jgi:hypothetical protein
MFNMLSLEVLCLFFRLLFCLSYFVRWAQLFELSDFSPGSVARLPCISQLFLTVTKSDHNIHYFDIILILTLSRFRRSNSACSFAFHEYDDFHLSRTLWRKLNRIHDVKTYRWTYCIVYELKTCLKLIKLLITNIIYRYIIYVYLLRV